MKLWSYLLLLLMILSCSEKKDPEVKAWTKLSDFPDQGMTAGVSFVIGSSAYRGFGNPAYSFWSYDIKKDAWKQVTDINQTMVGQVGFSIGGKGYLLPNNFYPPGGAVIPNYALMEYDPVANSWKALKPFPGTTSVGGVAFVINNKGYVVVGANFNPIQLFELWEYDPSLDTWTSKAKLPIGDVRSFASAFSINGKGYIVGGQAYSGQLYKEVWSYDPNTNTWLKKNDFPGKASNLSFGFSIKDKGYIGAGKALVETTHEFWQYDAASDTWKQLGDFPGKGTLRCLVSSDGNNGYVFGGGVDSNTYNESWRFDPNGN